MTLFSIVIFQKKNCVLEYGLYTVIRENTYRRHGYTVGSNCKCTCPTLYIITFTIEYEWNSDLRKNILP